MDNEKSHCRRCLLSEINPDTYYSTVLDYINSLSPENKVDNNLYSSRLNICLECDNLLDGMCILCGCFAEVRAVKKISNCPNLPNKW